MSDDDLYDTQVRRLLFWRHAQRYGFWLWLIVPGVMLFALADSQDMQWRWDWLLAIWLAGFILVGVCHGVRLHYRNKVQQMEDEDDEQHQQ